MKKIRRIMAFAAALTICMSTAVSCGGKDSTKTPSTADALISNSYRSEEIELPDELYSISDMICIEGTENVVIKGYDSDYQDLIYVTDTDFTDFTKLDVDLGMDDNAQNSFTITSSDDGTMYAVVTSVTHGDFPEPDWNDENFDYENFDFDAYYDAAEYSFKMIHVDIDGNVLDSNDIELEEDSSSDYTSCVNSLIYCGDEKFFASIGGEEDSYAIIGSDGKIQEKLNIDSDTWINYTAKASNGDIYCEYYGDSSSELTTIDMDSLKLSDDKVSLDDLGGYMARSMVTGAGDYLLYLPMNTGIYGLKADNTVEEIVNWIDSDIDGDYVSAFIGLDNGDFIIFYQDWSDDATLCRLTKRDTSELSDTIVMTIGMLWSDSEITSKITEFNKTSDKYRIKIVDYSEYDVYDSDSGTYTSSAVDQLKNDIISGNAPDMICVYDRSVIDTLSSKGVFADLYTLMENDSDLNKDMILPNILTALESDGKLYSISPSFTVYTYAAKTKFVGDNQDWTFDDMMEVCESLPDDMDVFADSNTSRDAFDNLFYTSLDEYVDYDKKTCSFDSDSFLEMLEFCNTLPAEDDDEPDYENMTDEEWEVYWNERETKCRSDKALLKLIYINQLSTYAQYRYGDFDDEITLVGTPTSDGKGASLVFNNSFAVMNDSSCKEAAWEFIKMFFTEDAYEDSYEMSVISDIFDRQAEESMERPYYLDNDGEKQYYDNTYYVGDQSITLDPLTEEEKDFMVDYVKKVTRICSTYDTDLYSIFDDEVDAYFAGDKSAEETAKMIQNRASILISEKN